MQYRQNGYALLRGHGLEIGALHNPAAIPSQCTVDYCDVISKEQAVDLFPELDPNTIVEPRYIANLDQGELSQFSDQQFDFVIISHVIEHLANPIAIVNDVFRITKYGGHVVMVCPDKRYTFDRQRDLTPFTHLVDEYQQHVSVVTNDHYRDMLRGVYPHIRHLSDEELDRDHVPTVRSRREHAHVWDSYSFKRFMQASLILVDRYATCVYEVYGEITNLEYFSVWRHDEHHNVAPSIQSHDSIELAEYATQITGLVNEVERQRTVITALHSNAEDDHNYCVYLEEVIQTKDRHIQALELNIQNIKQGKVLRLITFFHKVGQNSYNKILQFLKKN